jgi:hypothetical protein
MFGVVFVIHERTAIQKRCKTMRRVKDEQWRKAECEDKEEE